jgi:hypothetical protein
MRIELKWYLQKLRSKTSVMDTEQISLPLGRCYVHTISGASYFAPFADANQSVPTHRCQRKSGPIYGRESDSRMLLWPWMAQTDVHLCACVCMCDAYLPGVVH